MMRYNQPPPAGRLKGRLTRRQVLEALVLALVAVPLASCASQDDPSAPPTIRYGEDVCVACNMIISDQAYASAYRTVGGEARLFDDLGEMVSYHRRQRENVQAFYVHHYQTRAWLQAENAYFVAAPMLRTPMGFGVAAVGSEAEARTTVEQLGGRALSFQELMEQLDLSGRQGGPMRH